mmetsp:Transcript_18178/g.43769  ORF Transcript_18178/g.43769 Transcript_18178/m.43769 type:complete len:226 (-) Transcript_18178:164-841(-)
MPVFPRYRMNDVSKHCHLDDCWIAVGTEVHNLTKWLAAHPLQREDMMGKCGKYLDTASLPVELQEPAELSRYVIGRLEGSPAIPEGPSSAESSGTFAPSGRSNVRGSRKAERQSGLYRRGCSDSSTSNPLTMLDEHTSTLQGLLAAQHSELRQEIEALVQSNARKDREIDSLKQQVEGLQPEKMAKLESELDDMRKMVAQMEEMFQSDWIQQALRSAQQATEDGQ